MNSIPLNNSSWVIFDKIDLMTAGFTFSYITWDLKLCSAQLRFAQSFLKEKRKKTEKKEKRMPLFLGEEE